MDKQINVDVVNDHGIYISQKYKREKSEELVLL